MNKFYTYVLVSFIIFASLSINPTSVNADDEVGPVISSVIIDRERATRGQSVSLRLTANDIDGLATKGSLEILTPSGVKRTVKMDLIYDVDGNNNTYYFDFYLSDVNEYGDFGFYKILSTVLHDRYGNVSKVDLESKKLGFELYIDNEPPSVTEVNISRPVIYSIGHQDLYFSFKVEDEGRPEHYAYLYLKHVKSGQEKRVYLSFNEYEQEYKGYDSDWYDASFGEWIIDRIELSDVAGNQTTQYGPFIGENSLQLLNVDDDREKPKYISSNFEVSTQTYVVKAVDNSFLSNISATLKHKETGAEALLVADEEIFGHPYSAGMELSIPLTLHSRNKYKDFIGDWDVVKIEITDKNQNVQVVSNIIDSIEFDLSGPIVRGVEGKAYRDSVVPTFEEGTATLNDKAFISGTTVWFEGDYVLKVKDEFGNETVIHFSIDNKPVSIEGVNYSGVYKSVAPTFNEGHGFLNGNPYISGTIINQEGSYSLKVIDDAGNESNVWFNIDTTAPIVTGFVEGINTYREVRPIFTDRMATLNGKVIYSGIRVTQEGEYDLEVIDRAGNKTIIHFSIDRTAPVVTGLENKQHTNQSIVIQYNEGTATLNGKRILNNWSVKNSGNYTLRVTDQAGNTTVLTFTIDKVAPSKPSISTLTNKSTKVTGKAEKGSTVSITYNGRTYTTNASTAGTYSYSLKTTKAGATVTVRAKDAAGNLSTTASSKVLNTFATFAVNTIKSSTSSVTGKGNKGATVKAYVGSKAISKAAKVDSKGNYKLTIPRQKAGVTVTVKMTQTGYQELKKTTKVAK